MTPDEIESTLADALTLLEECLPETLMLGATGGARVGCEAPGSRPPANLGVILVRQAAERALHAAGRALLDEELAPRPAAPLAGEALAGWLHEHVYTLATVEQAEAIAADLATAARDVEDVVRPLRREWSVVGECPLLLEDSTVCGGQVRGWAHWLTEDGESTCICQWCHTVAGASSWADWGMGDPRLCQPMLSTEEVVLLARAERGARITEATVRQWVRRGHLAPERPGSRPLMFARSDALSAIAAMC